MSAHSHRLRRPTIYGRERERARLRQLLDDADKRHGSVVLISGEAGIGKTTLVDDLIHEAKQRDCLVLTGACYDLTTTPPYGPWAEITRGYAADEELPALPESLVAGQDLDTIPSQSALYRLVATFFADVADHRPLVLVLEDLHWSDLESPALLRYLARELANTPTLIITTYRDDELTRHDPLFQIIPLLVRESNAQRIELRRWDAEEISTFVQQQYALDQDDLARIVAYLEAQTDGNPLFIQEMLNTLEAEAILSRAGATWALQDLDRVAVPPFVVQLIEGRLSTLDAPFRELLEMASVIGQEVPLELWRQLADAKEDGLATALDQGFEAHLLEETANPGVVQFRHALVREALYSGIMLLQRQAWHRQLADLMLEMDNPDPDKLVTHLERASDPRLLDWLIQAGDSAAARFGWETAVERYERAVSLLELRGISDPARHCDMLLKLGNAQNSAGTGRGQDPQNPGANQGPGNDPQALATFWKVVEVARNAGLPVHLGEAALGIAGNNIVADHGGPDGIRLTAEALELLPDVDSRLHARLLARLATGIVTLDFHQGLTGYATVEQVDRWSTEAITMARRLRDRETLAYTLNCRNVIIEDCRHREEHRENNAEVAALTAQLRYLPLLADGLYSQIIDFTIAGELVAAAETFKRYVEVTEQLAMPVYDWRTEVHQAGLALSSGHYEEAGQRIDRCDGIWPMSAAGRAQKLILARELDDLETMNAIPHAGLDRLMIDTFQLFQLLESEDNEATRQLFEKRIDDGLIFGEMPQRSGGWLYIIAILAETCAVLNDDLRAQRLYEHLMPYDGLNIFARYSLFSMGATTHYLGLLAATMGERDRAEDHFARALEQNERWGFRPAADYTRFEWARMFINRGDATDLDRAHGMLSEALRTARQIGMVRLERLAKLLIEDVSAPDRPNPAGLSPRETEVIALVVEGMTNAEIGETLYISPRTVSQHLRSVYTKLNVNNRASAVARWIELTRG
ncbi:hypothetical protein BH23CHL2_BH23CHL2_22460 [soil metagenome]